MGEVSPDGVCYNNRYMEDIFYREHHLIESICNQNDIDPKSVTALKFGLSREFDKNTKRCIKWIHDELEDFNARTKTKSK